MESVADGKVRERSVLARNKAWIIETRRWQAEARKKKGRARETRRLFFDTVVDRRRVI